MENHRFPVPYQGQANGGARDAMEDGGSWGGETLAGTKCENLEGSAQQTKDRMATWPEVQPSRVQPPWPASSVGLQGKMAELEDQPRKYEARGCSEHGVQNWWWKNEPRLGRFRFGFKSQLQHLLAICPWQLTSEAISSSTKWQYDSLVGLWQGLKVENVHKSLYLPDIP